MELRKIVFRAKCKDNGDWVHGSYIANYNNNDWIVQGGDFFAVDSDTVGQFTGLLDKNGEEIYEGDILDVECEAVLYVVEWHDAGLKARQVSNRSTIGLSNWNKRISVIGNVHDNLELLKGRKYE